MLVIVDYKMGNLGSIANIIKKVGHESLISSDPEIILKADKLILPGVGAFDKAMSNLHELKLIDILHQKVLVEQTPVLGICLGMQLLSHKSEEGNSAGLGWIDGETVKFKLTDPFKIPHMGWNNVTAAQEHALVHDMYPNPRFYFVHSYHVVCSKPENILTQTNYGYNFTSGVVHKNIMGVQFHPEKSHKYGMKLIKNYIEKC